MHYKWTNRATANRFPTERRTFNPVSHFATDYDRLSHLVNGLHTKMHDTQNELLSAWLASKRIHSPLILDIGAGTCSDLIFLLRRNRTARAVAVDAAPEMLEVGTRKARRYGVASRMLFMEGSVRLLPTSELFREVCGTATADVIVCSMLLHHYGPAMKSTIYPKMRQLLNRRGLLIVSDLFDFDDSFLSEWSLRREVSGIRHRFREHQRRLAEHERRSVGRGKADFWVRHYQRFNRPSPISKEGTILRKSGFRTIECPFRIGQLGILFVTP